MEETTLSREQFTDLYIGICRDQRTGTLRVESSDGARKSMMFVEGFLAEIDTGREDTVLETALLSTGQLCDRSLKKARKNAAKAEITLGGALLELDVVDEGEVQQHLRQQIADEVCETFLWELGSFQFEEHEADERVEGFTSELSNYYEIYTDAEELFLEAARRCDEWELVKKYFGFLNDVFFATPSSMKYFDEQEQYPYENAIISNVDSCRSVSDVIDECRLDRFIAVNTVRKLVINGELDLIDPVQLYQLGLGHIDKGAPDKAYALFRRALENGFEDFDLRFKLAELLEELGRKQEAVEEYFAFALKCQQEDRLDEGLKTLRKILQLAPAYLEARKVMLELFLTQNRVEEATEEALAIAKHHAESNDPRPGLDLLLSLRERNPSDLGLQRTIVELAVACGDEKLANEERARLVEYGELQKDEDVALQTYQQMFCSGQDTVDIRLKLAEIHRGRGDRKKALEHLTALLNLSDRRRVRDEETLLWIHTTICELHPIDLRSNRWLIEYYLDRDETERAREQTLAWAGHLDKEGDYKEIAHVYEKLISFDDQFEHRWDMISVLQKLGRVDQSRRELRSLCNLALRRKEHDQASAAVERLVESAPLDLESRKIQLRLLESRGDAETAANLSRQMVQLAALSGDLRSAEVFAEHLGGGKPRDAHALRALSSLYLKQDNRSVALSALVRSASILADHNDHGSARETVEEIFAIDSDNAEAKKILAALDGEEVKAQATIVEAPPASKPQAAPRESTPRPSASTPQPAPRESTPQPVAPATPESKPTPIPVDNVLNLTDDAAPAATTASSPEGTATLPASSGTPEAAIPDAATPEAAIPDAGTPEAAIPDAEPPDAAVLETPDAGTPETPSGSSRPQAVEPFQPPPPIRTNVSNITARLRRLKTGGPSATSSTASAATSPAEGRGKVTRLSGLNKLKALQSGDSSPQPAASPTPADDGTTADTTAPQATTGEAVPNAEGGGQRAVSKKPLNSAAARLKALKGGGGSKPGPKSAKTEESPTTVADTSAASTSTSAAATGEAVPNSEGGGTRVVSKKALNSAAARLKALASGGSKGPSTSDTNARTEVVEGPSASTAETSTDAAATGEAVPNSEGGGTRVVSKKALNSAAARLKALASGGSKGPSTSDENARTEVVEVASETLAAAGAGESTDSITERGGEDGGGVVAKTKVASGAASRLAALRAKAQESVPG